MRIFIYISFLALPSLVFSQSPVVEKVKEYIDKKQYSKVAQFVDQNLKKAEDEELRSALWYYKGKSNTQEYFEYANTVEEGEEAYRNRSYLLLEGLAAFQNAAKRENPLYKDMALRQIGGLHRYLKEIAFSYLHQKNYERFFLNLQWARNSDRFVQQYIGEDPDYQMDTMLIYLVAYGAELTNRSFEAKAFYETLLLEGLSEKQMFIDHYSMLMALDEESKAERILEQALRKFPESSILLKYKLRSLMMQERYEEAIRFVEEKQELLPQREASRLYFVKGMAWNARYEEALKANKMDADLCFMEAEKAYKEAVGLSPTSFDYAYNLAALYYNKVVLIQPDSLPGAEAEKDYDLFVKRAAETLETTLNLNESDRKVLDALEDIYRRTNQTEKLRLLQQPKG